MQPESYASSHSPVVTVNGSRGTADCSSPPGSCGPAAIRIEIRQKREPSAAWKAEGHEREPLRNRDSHRHARRNSNPQPSTLATRQPQSARPTPHPPNPRGERTHDEGRNKTPGHTPGAIGTPGGTRIPSLLIRSHDHVIPAVRGRTGSPQTQDLLSVNICGLYGGAPALAA